MSDSPRFLVLQHAGCEPPCVYEDRLREHDAELVRVQLDAGERLPSDPGEFDGVIAMGGPMGVYETVGHPWLVDELALIGTAVHSHQPVWGVCLGAQLIAASLGSRVAPGPQPEIGVLEVALTDAAAADSVFAAAPARFRALQWHSDTYELPDGAAALASSALYPQQAFQIANSYGLQFHLEVPVELLSDWAQLPAYAQALAAVYGPGALQQLLADWQDGAPAANALAAALFENWLTEVVGLPAAAGVSVA